MTLQSGFFRSIGGDRRYKADFFASYFSSFIGNGVFPNPSSGLQVIADSNLTVNVQPGKGWINGYYLINDTPFPLTLDNADGVLSRIDRVVMQWNVETRTIELVVKKGLSSTNPVAPTLQRDASIYELGLADIRINNGATQVGQPQITDLRLNSQLCGIVSGTVNQVDTTTLFNQYNEAFGQNLANNELAFQQFLDTLQDTLSGDVAGNLFNLIQDNKNDITTLNGRLNTHTNPGSIDSHSIMNITGLRTELNKIGNTSNLLTTNKNDLVSSVNELFTSVNNGKNIIANAIVGKGQPASGANTFAELANAINNISTGDLNVSAGNDFSVYYDATESVGQALRAMRLTKSVTTNLEGSVRLSVDLRSTNANVATSCAFYKNGTQISSTYTLINNFATYVTYTFDTNVSPGDVIDVYTSSSGTNASPGIRNFKLSVSEAGYITKNTVV